MNKIFCIFYSLVIAMSMLASPAFAQDVRIGYVNGFRIENDTKRAFDITEALKREFAAREQEVRAVESKVKAAQAQLAGITQTREREMREREFQTMAQRFEQMGRAFVDDLERRKAEERRKYFQEVTAIVQKIADAQKFDLVLQEAVYASKAVDITEQVIKALGGPAPGGKPATK